MEAWRIRCPQLVHPTACMTNSKISEICTRIIKNKSSKTKATAVARSTPRSANGFVVTVGGLVITRASHKKIGTFGGSITISEKLTLQLCMQHRLLDASLVQSPLAAAMLLEETELERRRRRRSNMRTDKKNGRDRTTSKTFI